MAHNGKRVQANPYFGQVSQDFLYVNALKSAQNWGLVDNSGLPDPTTLDSMGYPTSISNGGVYTVFYVPTTTYRPGRWVCRWTGSGTIYIPTVTDIVGSVSGLDGRFTCLPGDVSTGFLEAFFS